MGRLDEAMRRIDAANAEDPNRVVVDGHELPKEWVYARRISDRLETFAPGASEALRLAVRAQHLCRWRIPRDDYPRTRQGYKRWRSELARMHANLAAGIVREVGYDDDTVTRVRDLIMKKRLRTDPEAQTLEDVACLVFLEHYFADFAARHDDAKIVDILRKTWRKMSDSGRREAARVSLGEQESALLSRALSPERPEHG